MHFDQANLMILGALAASLFLTFRSGDRIPAVVALIAAGLEALIAFRLATFHGIPYRGFVLAAALAAGGAWSWLRASSKPAATAATVVTLIGLLQLLAALRLLG